MESEDVTAFIFSSEDGKSVFVVASENVRVLVAEQKVCGAFSSELVVELVQVVDVRLLLVGLKEGRTFADVRVQAVELEEGKVFVSTVESNTAFPEESEGGSWMIEMEEILSPLFCC